MCSKFVGPQSDQFISAQTSRQCRICKNSVHHFQFPNMIELNINRVKLQTALQKVTGVTGRLHSSDAATCRWIEKVRNLLEAFEVQVFGLPPNEPLSEKWFNFIKQTKDEIVEKLDFENLGFELKFENHSVMSRLWRVASAQFLQDINNHDITGPFAAPAIKTRVNKVG